jgi:hypothetical protein
MKIARLAYAICAIALLAGCSGNDASDSPGLETLPGTVSEPTSPTEGPPAPITVNTSPFNFTLTGCVGAETGFTWPPGTGPHPSVPPGWEPAFRLGDVVDLEMVSCERVAWGPFERGPVSMLFELHGQFNSPTECERGDWNRFRMLNSWWVDDVELAAFMQEELALNTTLGRLSHEVLTVGPIREVIWTWNIDGHDDSTVTFRDHQRGPFKSTYAHRIGWFDESRLFVMDMATSFQLDMGNIGHATGRMERPMMYSSYGISEYASRGTALDSYEATATIHPYEDFACGES